ncbi:amino acid transporters [Moorella thermoacetica Y72]|uniref:Amino acid transporters n=1 Tax=Moorella thermoacetica Y72 TaxID=1325331 RepID=A0A0S6UDC0_NEOTH|nr:amino acid transporters [Moorella thermoacetica Y72]
MGIWRTKKIADLMQEAGDNQKLKRSIGTPELVALGVGAIIGSGIFVLTGVAAANYAGPALVFSFILSGLAAGLAALVYAEMAAMIPVTGSAYTYAYASLGEIIAWLVGWNLVLEYLVASGAVAVGWSGYITDMLASVGVFLPRALVNSPLSGGLVNLPAILITVVMTGVAIVGTTTSARTNKIIVGVKILVILVFLALGAPRVNTAYWHPSSPSASPVSSTGRLLSFSPTSASMPWPLPPRRCATRHGNYPWESSAPWPSPLYYMWPLPLF